MTNIFCDGCARKPSFWEWVRGELTSAGYHEWRHPGIIFKEHGLPIVHEHREKASRVFRGLFGREMPEEMSYLCPECQAFASRELPALIEADEQAPPTAAGSQQEPRHFFG
ncbi:MAG TPA: hypothetical protein VFU47_04980 [Armatimonadota bacterium]|nr:hypothetical protein [Armatimonadota bacterium]